MHQLPILISYLSDEKLEQSNFSSNDIADFEADLKRLRAGYSEPVELNKLSKEQAKGRFVREKQRSWFSVWPVSIFAAATLFVSVYVINFSYYHVLPEKSFVNVVQPTAVKRPNLFWGYSNLKSNKVYLNNDVISAEKSLNFQLENYAQIHMAQKSQLKLLAANTQLFAQPITGEILFNFEVKTQYTKREIRFTEDESLFVVGTIILTQTDKKKRQFVTLTGVAQVNGKQVVAGEEFNFIGNTTRKKSRSELKEIGNRFKAQLPQKWQKKYLGKRDIIPKNIKNPIKYFKKKYGKVYKVFLKNKEVFYAAKLSETSSQTVFMTLKGRRVVKKAALKGTMTIE